MTDDRATLELIGWPPDGPTLGLDHERFAYAGKFVMSNTGKAVARDPGAGDVLAAVAFNADRTDETTLWLRYVTVRADRRGDGVGPRLLAFVRDRALARGYERLQIAVNNPFAYEALAKIGFSFEGETTGIAELVLVYEPTVEAPAGEVTAEETTSDGTTSDETTRAAPVDAERYRRGLAAFRGRERDLSDDEAAFVAEKLERGPPERID